jgi:hypothetical protein
MSFTTTWFIFASTTGAPLFTANTTVKGEVASIRKAIIDRAKQVERSGSPVYVVEGSPDAQYPWLIANRDIYGRRLIAKAPENPFIAHAKAKQRQTNRLPEHFTRHPDRKPRRPGRRRKP